MSCKILETGQVSLSDGVNCEKIDQMKTLKPFDCNELKTCEACLPPEPRMDFGGKEIFEQNIKVSILFLPKLSLVL